jgi:hypothetical protein
MTRLHYLAPVRFLALALLSLGRQQGKPEDDTAPAADPVVEAERLKVQKQVARLTVTTLTEAEEAYFLENDDCLCA